MAMMLTPNGERIKALREGRLTGYRQKEVAQKSAISVRSLRRIENENRVTRAEDLQRLAAALDTNLHDIAFAPEQPRLVCESKSVADDSCRSDPSDDEFIFIPRFSTTYLQPIKSANDLCNLAKSCQQVVLHLLAETDAERLALIEELLTLLTAISDREWSFNGAPKRDAYDDQPFPEIARLKRMAELLVLLKGNDIRICADQHSKRYQPGEKTWLKGWDRWSQLLIAFAPPSYFSEDTVEVPVDHGMDIKVPRKPIF